jgi:anthranilate/para-aminobenzoate synthase component II
MCAARYHSLVIEAASLPSDLRVTAYAVDDEEIMAVEHRYHTIIGVQFHPESAATEYGYCILDRFLHGAASVANLPVTADARAIS